MKAFPSNGFYERTTGGEQPQKLEPIMGMELRDYFAAKAMQAIIANSDQKSIGIQEVDNWVGDYAYIVADAMMEARENDYK